MNYSISLSPLGDVPDFRDHWRAMVHGRSNASFFQSPAWLETWAETSSGDNLVALMCRSSEGPAAMAIVCETHDALHGTQILFHEVGDPLRDAIYCEYNDFLLSNAVNQQDVRQACLEALLDKFPKADSFLFRNCREDFSKAIHAVCASRSLSARIINKNPVYVCDLTSGHPFTKSVSKSLRTKIERSIRLYKERGELTLTIPRTPSDEEQAWKELTQLHEEAWEARGKKGAFSNHHFSGFHKRLREKAQSQIDLVCVRAGSDTIGVLYNFRDNRQVLNYQSGFRFEANNQFAPGFVTHALAAQFYQDQGFGLYNLLAGDADYKRRLGKQAEMFESIVVERPSWRNKLLSVARTMKSMMRA